MALLGTVVQAFLELVTGEVVGAAAEKPLGRLTTELRRRLTLPLVLVAWVLGVAGMGLAWRLGASGVGGVLGAVAILLWIVAPVTALLVTGLWWHRRDA